MSWTRKKISLAVSAALAGTSASVANAQIEEIIVTATKRAESAQDVPISVQAVTGDDLRDLRVETFDQYVEYLPNVVSTGNGPGKKELYIRGSATEQSGVTVAAAQGSAPGVALYVDEQPVSFGARNEGLVQDDWNEATYRGARIGFAYDINDDWGLLVQHTLQTLQAEGSFIAEPNIAEDVSAKFAPEYNRDDFGLTTWTLSGRLSQLELIYTGGLLDREVDSLIDYTHYNNGGGYITYYLCSGNLYDLTDPNDCFDPTKHYVEDTANSRLTHEFRVHTDPTRRWRLLGGVVSQRGGNQPHRRFQL